MNRPRCNGIRYPRERFSESTTAVLVSIARDLRIPVAAGFHLNGRDDVVTGSRFNDDSGIVARVESAVTERGFRGDPEAWVRAALVDAAESDHWYTHEKVWE